MALIICRLLSATNTKGVRVKATGIVGGERLALTLPFDYEKSYVGNCRAAAVALSTKYCGGAPVLDIGRADKGHAFALPEMWQRAEWLCNLGVTQ